jgi:hypothetical protein
MNKFGSTTLLFPLIMFSTCDGILVLKQREKQFQAVDIHPSLKNSRMKELGQG